MKKEVIVEVSARHLHIAKADYKALFNKDGLTKLKDISQPNQFAANETVILHGPKFDIENVRILGPFRNQTQIEIAKTDAYTLGIEAPLRLSGQLKDSTGITIIGPAGHIELKQGVIIALRHLHISTKQAAEWNLKHDQNISISVGQGINDNIKERCKNIYRD